MNKIKFWLITILCIIALGFISCTNSDDWYPSGNVKISSFSEYKEGSGNKIGVIFYSVENTGNSKIVQSTVSFKILTDMDEYYNTKVSQTTILPGKKIWENIAITYFNSVEVSALDKVTIEDSFFE